MSFPRVSANPRHKLEVFAAARKYKSGADEWLILASIASSPRLVDMFGWVKEPWRQDAELEEITEMVLKPGVAIEPGGQKIGRNSPCPCRSGLKFKKCHGK